MDGLELVALQQVGKEEEKFGQGQRFAQTIPFAHAKGNILLVLDAHFARRIEKSFGLEAIRIRKHLWISRDAMQVREDPSALKDQKTFLLDLFSVNKSIAR